MDKKINLGARGLVVMTSLSHSEGRRFKSGRAHFLFGDIDKAKNVTHISFCEESE